MNKLLLIGSLVAVVTLLSAGPVAAWTAPTSAPPNGNTAPPINTSASNQTKTGVVNVSGGVNAPAPGGFQSLGNYGGTGSAAYFPSGLWSNSANAWIYGAIYTNGNIYGSNAVYYLNPAATTNLSTLCIRGDCKTAWPAAAAEADTLSTVTGRGATTNSSIQVPLIYDINNTAYYLDPASVSITNDMRANIFYDQGNTAYYLDPNGTSNANLVYTNDLRTSVMYDKDNTAYYLDPNGTSNTSGLLAQSWMQAPIFYDINNTAYYVDPASTSILNNVCLAGTCRTTWPATGITAEADTLSTVTGRGATTNSTVQVPFIYDINNTAYYLDPNGTSNANLVYTNDLRTSVMYDKDNTGYYLDPNSTSNTYAVLAQSNMQSPIFYDLNNTGYYLDPNGTSNTNGLLAQSWVQAPIFYDINNTGYYLDPSGTSNVNTLAASRVNVSTLCLNGDCRTSWSHRGGTPGWYGTQGYLGTDSTAACQSTNDGALCPAGMVQTGTDMCITDAGWRLAVYCSNP